MISVVVPIFNEEENIAELAGRLKESASAWGEPVEFVAVDDGSTDQSWNLLVEQRQWDARWKLIRLSRNFGHQSAISAGLAHAQGDAVVVMDADLQDPPEMIAEFLDYWRAGAQVVYAVRASREARWFKKLAYHAFYTLVQWTKQSSADRLPAHAGDFCLMDRPVVDLLVHMPEHHRFLRGMRAFAGFRQVGVPHHRPARHRGTPKYTFAKLCQLAGDGFCSQGLTPLRLATAGGLLSLLAGVGLPIVWMLWWMLDLNPAGLSAHAIFGHVILASMLFVATGVQLLAVGILGEYVGRVFEQVRGRPTWICQQTLGLSGPDRQASSEMSSSSTPPLTIAQSA